MRTCLTELRAEPFAAEREWTVEGIPVLTAAVELPQPLDADAVSRRIRRYYQAQCKAFLRYCERWLFPQAEAEYRAALAASARSCRRQRLRAGKKADRGTGYPAARSQVSPRRVRRVCPVTSRDCVYRLQRPPLLYVTR